MSDVIDEHDIDADRAGASSIPENRTEEPAWWIQRAAITYKASADWMRTYKQPSWRRNLAHSHNQHAPDSKYHTSNFRSRARGFRPLTKSVVQRNLTACETAFFSTPDALSLQAANPRDDDQKASAAIWQEMMAYRLDKTIPWKLTLLGAFYDTMHYDTCVAYVGWAYEPQPKTGDEHGEFVDPNISPIPLKDEPVIDVIKPQHFLTSLDADWRNVVNTATTLIERRPTSIDTVRNKMLTGEYAEAPLTQGFEFEWDEMDDAQSGGKQPSAKDAGKEIPETQPLNVLHVITRVDGVDYCFEMLGPRHLLTVPQPLSEKYLHGKRPYVMGVSELESHTLAPDGLVTQVADMQTSANELANLRMDGVKLGLVPRMAVKDDASIDMRALSMAVPGLSVKMGNPREDVRELKTSDVSQGSFAEQDRISADFDTLAGNFSQSSVATNRRLGDTAQGMELISNDSNSVVNFRVSLFADTFAKPTLELLLLTMQAFERDANLFAVAAEEAELVEKFGVEEITDYLLTQQITTKLDVGLDATNPARKVEKIRTAALTALELGKDVNATEISKFIFSALGIKDSDRFLTPEEQPAPQEDPVIAIKRMELELKKQQFEAQHQRDVEKLKLEREVNMLRVAATENISLTQVRARLQEALIKDQTQRDIAAVASDNHRREIKFAEVEGHGI